MSGDAEDRELAYLLFKTAQALHRKRYAELEPADRDAVRRVAARQRAIESRVLAAPEAGGAFVPQASVDGAVGEIRQRYADDEEFAADLSANGLDRHALEAALRRELAVEAVLEKVARVSGAVSDTDAELYYRLHIERFMRPERRLARHILITVNEQFDENRREAARARIEAVGRRVARAPERFAEQAAKHSECPSALQGGMLGEIRRGQLFPALEAALFALDSGELGGIVESPLGYHLLRCDAILAPAVLPFAEALPGIRSMLVENRAQSARRTWLRTLLREGSAPVRQEAFSGSHDPA